MGFPCVPRLSVAGCVVISKLVKDSRWATRHIPEIYHTLAFGAATERFPVYCFWRVLFIQRYQRKDYLAYVARHEPSHSLQGLQANLRESLDGTDLTNN